MTQQQQLPPGIWFETARGRYRVRLFRQTVCVWRSYHKNLDDALRVYDAARTAQLTWRPPAARPVRAVIPQTVLDLFPCTHDSSV